MFESELANSLPSHPQYINKITLEDGVELPFGPLYGMSREDLIVLKNDVKDNLENGWIRGSSPSTGSPFLFVKKADGTKH